jgi:hypothetical protein
LILLLALSACFIDTAAQVADRVTDPDKIIHDYEWFHTAGQRIGARQAQISSTHALLSDSTVSDSERARTRIDLSGQQQSCRELVADYNANGQKVTVNVWKGWSLPDYIDPAGCE